MREIWKRLREFLRHREALSCFVLLTDDDEVKDFAYVTGRSARKSNEVDFAFGEFIDYQVKCNCSELYIPPLRIIRFEVTDDSILPKGNRETTEYVENRLLPMLDKGEVMMVKDFDFRSLYFVLIYGVYPRMAICGSVGLLKTPRCKAKNYIVNTIGYSDVMTHERYDFYEKMIALQDERHKR